MIMQIMDMMSRVLSQNSNKKNSDNHRNRKHQRPPAVADAAIRRPVEILTIDLLVFANISGHMARGPTQVPIATLQPLDTKNRPLLLTWWMSAPRAFIGYHLPDISGQHIPALITMTEIIFRVIILLLVL